MYGSKLKERQRLDLRTAELWTLAIKNSGISLKQFKQAAVLSLNLEWPPSAAQDFVNLIKPKVVNEYPTAQDAFTTACQNCGMRGDVKRNWKHGVVYETANRIGWGKLASASEGYFRAFKDVYESVCSEHRDGKDFTIPKDRQITYEHTPVAPGSDFDRVINERLAELSSKGRNKEQI